MKQPAPEQVVQRGTQKQYLEAKKIEMPYKSLQYTAKTVLRGKFIELHIIGKRGKTEVISPTLHIEILGEKSKLNPKLVEGINNKGKCRNRY